MPASSREHVLAELARLDAVLEAGVAAFRDRVRSGDLSAYYVSDEEVDAVLDTAPGPRPPTLEGGAYESRLALVAGTFGLTPPETDALLICLAPEVDRRYERIYGYLQDDVTRRAPSVDLVLNLTCADLPAKVTGRERFSPSRPLVGLGLVTLHDPPGGPAVSLLDRTVRLEPRVARFLLGDGPVAPETPVPGVTRIVPAGDGPPTAPLDAGRPMVCPAPDAEEVLPALTGHALVQLAADRLPEECARLLVDVGREVRLTGAVTLVSGIEALTGTRLDQVVAWLGELPGPVVVIGPADVLEPVLPTAVRLDLPVDPVAARRRARRRLRSLARLVPPRHTWSDLVLPEPRAQVLRELADVAKYRERVLDEWGFAASAGPGLTLLFAGPSGTGKTMAAQVIARELGRDLFAVDLASMVSKYIGETEKNLAAVFDAAAGSGCVLFFDEADAMFGKRTAVRDAHDRYANIQTSYLLQKLDEHEGVVVLATNLRKNMDEAFVRRLHAVVEFPVPREEDRLRIWQRLWPPSAPLDPALDLAGLAARIDLPGGHLRNIALGAAYLAAADGGVITMEHLARAARREYQHLGKVMPADAL